MKKYTFKELRDLFAIRLAPISICELETLSYENFATISDVPETYNDFYVYGIGQIESEFFEIQKGIYAAKGEKEQLVLIPCIEIIVSKNENASF